MFKLIKSRAQSKEIGFYYIIIEQITQHEVARAFIAKGFHATNTNQRLGVITISVEIAEVYIQIRANQLLTEFDVRIAYPFKVYEFDSFNHLFCLLKELRIAICCNIVLEIAIIIEFQDYYITYQAEVQAYCNPFVVSEDPINVCFYSHGFCISSSDFQVIVDTRNPNDHLTQVMCY